MSAKNKESQIVVTCSLAEGSIKRVEKHLLEIGFEIEQTLEFAGNILGRWDKSLEILRKIPEVDDVAESEMNFPQGG